jgi:DNA-binding Xre family transcriptional regulator
MVRLRILDILEEQNHTKYWLYKRMDMLSYRNFQNIVENKTSSIHFETIEKLSRILDVPIGDLSSKYLIVAFLRNTHHSTALSV